MRVESGFSVRGRRRERESTLPLRESTWEDCCASVSDGTRGTNFGTPACAGRHSREIDVSPFSFITAQGQRRVANARHHPSQCSVVFVLPFSFGYRPCATYISISPRPPDGNSKKASADAHNLNQ